MISNPLLAHSAGLSDDEALRVASQFFGKRGAIRRLAGEKDDLFAIETTDRHRYFLKIAHPSESETGFDLITQAMLHVERTASTVPIPRVIPTIADDPQVAVPTTAGPVRWTRMTTFIPGQLLKSVHQPSASLRFNVGAALARLAGALRTFEHPGAERRVGWDIANAIDCLPLVDELPDTPETRVWRKLLETHHENVAPRLKVLRRQPVHNDLNTDNVFVDPQDDRVLGMIDLDDLTVSQVINDVAVSAAGHLGTADAQTALKPALDLARGYHAVTPLTEAELTILPSLMAVRLAMYLVIGTWRAERFPDKAPYILRKAPLVRQQLKQLSLIPPQSAVDQAARVANE